MRNKSVKIIDISSDKALRQAKTIIQRLPLPSIDAVQDIINARDAFHIDSVSEYLDILCHGTAYEMIEFLTGDTNYAHSLLETAQLALAELEEEDE